MKNMLLFVFAALTIVLLQSCKKTAIIADKALTDGSIMGKWNIITDSTFAGAGINNHPVAYTGQSGDYFDISADGNVYLSEDASLDVLRYNNLTDSTIAIASFGINANGVQETSRIISVSGNEMVISAPNIYTPGGIFGRTIHLSR